MFAKDKITQSMIDAVNSVIGEESKISEPVKLDENKGSSPQETFTDNNPETGVDPKVKKKKKKMFHGGGSSVFYRYPKV